VVFHVQDGTEESKALCSKTARERLIRHLAVFAPYCKCDYLMAKFFDNYMTPITDSFLNGRVLRPAYKALSIAKGKKRQCWYYAK
jgi:hypothetical protein